MVTDMAKPSGSCWRQAATAQAGKVSFADFYSRSEITFLMYLNMVRIANPRNVVGGFPKQSAVLAQPTNYVIAIAEVRIRSGFCSFKKLYISGDQRFTMISFAVSAA